jgi:hypothetical protein
MLTEEAKIRIRLEEEYRLNIRRELESATVGKTRQSKTWALLNSSFALWFLSTIVLGLITWAYSSYTNRLAGQSAEAERIRHLDLEISGRISAVPITLDIWGSDVRIRGDRLYSLSGIYLGVASILDNDRLDASGNRHDDSQFPEYRERHFTSLLVERLSTADAVHREYLLKARDGYKQFYRLGYEVDPADFGDWPPSKRVAAVKEAVANSKQILRQNFIAPEWSTEMFPNSDKENSSQ